MVPTDNSEKKRKEKRDTVLEKNIDKKAELVELT
jgi:hypothetical protein